MTAIFKRGLAIGQSDIRADCWHFRFYDEFFIVRGNLRTRRLRGRLVAKIRDVRKAANA